jgi:N-acyl homoserine lactone hydrolase
MYKIYPLDLGTFTAMETSNLLYQIDPGKKVIQPILGWLLLGGDKPIVVDTGGSDEEWANKYHHGLLRSNEQRIENQLKKHGVNIDDVELVINTHLHWDHCFQNDKFKHAKFLVQKKELQSALTPLPTQANYYETNLGELPSWMRTFHKMEVVDGDYDLDNGLQLVHLPGHTPGLQGVIVPTAKGSFLIASDTIGVYENWLGNEKMKHIPQGIHWDLESYFETFKKMEKLKCEVLPCHDMRVLEHEFYG